MRSVMIVSALWVLAVAPSGTNVIVERVESIESVPSEPRAATLVVFVVDTIGRPMGDAVVEVIDAKGQRIAQSKSEWTGAVRFEFEAAARVTVRASAHAHRPSEARNVALRVDRLAAVALPLAVAPLDWLGQ